MFEAFFLLALVGGVGVALAAGPLGSMVIWRRMAYFGDSLAHSALLGVALGVILGIGATIGVLVVAVGFAGLLVALEHQKRLGMDALLGIFSHSALALGLVALSLSASSQVDLMSFIARRERSASIVAKSSVTAMKVRASLIERASLHCQLRFHKVFLNALVGRLSQATQRIASA